ncbi:MlaD family protein [Prevotella sp. kh1p2]|uniref:MlaD family protein n=1 Tax=Prevotella sp. kh1p2 TaxID=1761883 RepID=UPI0008B59C64|nr:MlaD family protein [Prevotella sp. kh1p2]SES75395.1 phospholipid/cholesterol/gamma-HCH transport system substrate-binding protein [Prevotella sp. kh1p2]SNU10523.1 phospholipid/cholesterol/gamma-HCH transport system substrate-binding protein [Prevotellaceae bacterium KH2P17]
MKFFTKEVKIALVAIAGIVIVYFGMNFLKGMTLFSDNNTYYIKFKDVSGLTASNPIFADGYQVGIVKNIDYDFRGKRDIVVEFEVDNSLRIPRGSSAEIESDFMGNVKMNLLLANNPRERVEPGDTIVGELSTGLMGGVQKLLPSLDKVLLKLDSILTSVNGLMADPALQQSLHNIRTATNNLTASTNQLNTLMGDLNRNVPGMLTKANGVLDNTNKLTGNLAAVDVAGTMQQVDETIAGLKNFSNQLNSREGSLGLLMNDASLYNNLNATMKSADSLLVNVRQHPKRYVHFSLFGKKDK